MKGDLGVKGDLSVAGQYPITLGTLSAGDNYHLVLAGDADLKVIDRIRSETGSDTENTPGKATPRKRAPRNSTSDKRVVPVGDTRTNGILLLITVLCGAGAGAMACRKSQKTDGKQ